MLMWHVRGPHWLLQWSTSKPITGVKISCFSAYYVLTVRPLLSGYSQYCCTFIYIIEHQQSFHHDFCYPAAHILNLRNWAAFYLKKTIQIHVNIEQSIITFSDKELHTLHYSSSSHWSRGSCFLQGSSGAGCLLVERVLKEGINTPFFHHGSVH